MTRRERLIVASRIAAAVLGALLLALVASVCLSLAVPDPRGLGVALGVALAIPLWVAAMCLGFLAKSAARLWAAYLAGAAALAMLAWILP
jgi:hypothetical protein